MPQPAHSRSRLPQRAQRGLQVCAENPHVKCFYATAPWGRGQILSTMFEATRDLDPSLLLVINHSFLHNIEPRGCSWLLAYLPSCIQQMHD